MSSDAVDGQIGTAPLAPATSRSDFFTCENLLPSRQGSSRQLPTVPSGFIPLDDPELAWPSEQRFKHFERVVPVSVVLVRKTYLAVWQLITLQQERDCVMPIVDVSRMPGEVSRKNPLRIG